MNQFESSLEHTEALHGLKNVMRQNHKPLDHHTNLLYTSSRRWGRTLDPVAMNDWIEDLLGPSRPGSGVLESVGLTSRGYISLIQQSVACLQ